MWQRLLFVLRFWMLNPMQSPLPILILIALLVILPRGSWADERCEEFAALEDGQFAVMQHGYQVGREHNLGYTMAALALQESESGKYLVNLNDPSFGPWQVTVGNIVHFRGEGREVSDWSRDRMIERMMTDIRWSAETALQVLLYWDDYHNRTGTYESLSEYWVNLWGSYNAGIYYSGTTGRAYADEVQRLVRNLSLCNVFGYLESGV